MSGRKRDGSNASGSRHRRRWRCSTQGAIISTEPRGMSIVPARSGPIASRTRVKRGRIQPQRLADHRARADQTRHHIHRVVRRDLDAVHLVGDAPLLVACAGQQQQRPEQRRPPSSHAPPGSSWRSDRAVGRARIPRPSPDRARRAADRTDRAARRSPALTCASRMISSISAIQRRWNRRRPRSRSVGIDGGSTMSSRCGRAYRMPYSVSRRRIAGPNCRVSSENIERPAISSARFCIAASRLSGSLVCAASSAMASSRARHDMARQQRQGPWRERRSNGASLEPPVIARAEQQAIAHDRPQDTD